MGQGRVPPVGGDAHEHGAGQGLPEVALGGQVHRQGLEQAHKADRAGRGIAPQGTEGRAVDIDLRQADEGQVQGQLHPDAAQQRLGGDEDQAEAL